MEKKKKALKTFVIFMIVICIMMPIKYVEAAQSLYGLTEEQISNLSISGMIHNLLPVTIGNIIGGAICVAGFYYCIYMIRWGKKKEEK